MRSDWRGRGLKLRHVLLAWAIVACAALALPVTASAANAYTVVVSAANPVNFPEAPTFRYDGYLGGQPLPAGYSVTGKATCSRVYAKLNYGPTEAIADAGAGTWNFVNSSCQSYDPQTGLDLAITDPNGDVVAHSSAITVQGGTYTVIQSQTLTTASAVEGPKDSNGFPTSVKFTASVTRSAGESAPIAGLIVAFAYEDAFGIVRDGCTATTTADSNFNVTATCTLNAAAAKNLYQGTGSWTAAFPGTDGYGGSVATGRLAGLTSLADADIHRWKTLKSVKVEAVYTPPGCFNPYVGIQEGSIIEVSLGELNCGQLKVLQITTGVFLGIALAAGGGSAEVVNAIEAAQLASVEVAQNVARVALSTLRTAGGVVGSSLPGSAKPLGASVRSDVAGTPARSAVITPNALAVDAAGNVFVGDFTNHVVEKITPDGGISTVAGTAGTGGAIAPGPATATQLSNPSGLALDRAGNLFIADSGVNQVVAKVDGAGALSVVAGQQGQLGPVSPGPAPSGATASNLNAPSGLAVDSQGNLYIADAVNSTIEKVTPAGDLSIVAGVQGTEGKPTEGPATASTLWQPSAVVVDGAGDLYIADAGNGDVEKVDATTGDLTIVAGIPGESDAPTEGPATDSNLADPTGLALDTAGNLYIADPGNNMVEKVDTSGTLSIVAGTGQAAFPTPGTATASALSSPGQVAVDSGGNLYIGDSMNNLVEKVSGGQLSILAGTGATNPITTIQQAGVFEINKELASLVGVTPSVNSDPWLVQGNKDAATAILDGARADLMTLADKLAADTTAAAASADYQAIFTTYEVYALVLPQARLAAAADNLLNGAAPSIDDAYTQLHALLTGAGSSHDSPELDAALADLQAQSAIVKANTTGVAASVLAFTAADYRANAALLDASADKIATANAAATAASADIDKVVQALVQDDALTSGQATAFATLATDQSTIDAASSSATANRAKALDHGGHAITADSAMTPADPSATAVDCVPTSIEVGKTTTCTVTVSDTAGVGASAPHGAVTVSSSPATGAFAPSAACTLAATSSPSASSCQVVFTPSATGSVTVGAAFSGNAAHAASSGRSSSLTVSASSGDGSGGGGATGGGTGSTPGGGSPAPGATPTIVPTAPNGLVPAITPIGKLTLGRTKVVGKAVSVPLTCAGSGSCAVKLSLSVTETRKRGKITAIAAATKTKTSKTTVVVGSGSLTLTGGTSKTVTLTLNGTGKSLLATFKRLKVKLAVTSGVLTVATPTVTFTAPKKR